MGGEQDLAAFVAARGSALLRLALQSGVQPPAALTGESAVTSSETLADLIVTSSNEEDLGVGRRVDIVRKEVAGQAVPSRLEVSRSGRQLEIPITGSDPIIDARILGWADGGIVVRMHSRDRQYGNRAFPLRLYDPDRGTYRIISRPSATSSYPVAIATDVVGSGRPVPGVRPKFSGSDRRHLQYLTAQGWIAYRAWIVVGVFGLAGLVGTLLWRRRRRRRT